MAEKRGHTEKLNYPFNSAGLLEVYMKDTWYRATGKEFRSFNGKRRISGQEYDGPVYLYGTNYLADTSEYEPDKIVEHKWKSIRRPGE